MAKRPQPTIPEDFLDPGLPTGIFSPSQYGSYKRCARAYRYRYVEKLRMPPNVAMVKGTVVHAGAEMTHKRLLAQQPLPSLEEAKATIVDAFKEEQTEVTDWDGLKPGEVQDDALRLYATYHREAAPKVRPVEVEQHHLGRIGGVPVQVYLDLVEHRTGPAQAGIEDPGELIIADLKTTTTTWTQDDLEKDPQFTAYALVRRITTVRVDNLVSLKAGPKLTQRTALRTRHHLAVLEEDYAEVADAIKKGDFPMTSIDNWACTPRWCGYYGLCRGRAR